MTKDWDLVRSTIKGLSVDQKKPLEDVKSIMESEHKFRASTRAYRMKLKEWGYLRHKPRKPSQTQRDASRESTGGEEGMDVDDSDDTATPGDVRTINSGLLEGAEDLLPVTDPWIQARSMTTDALMDILAALLEGRAEDMERMIMKNPNLVNYPIGLPFEAHGGRFHNHPAIEQCVFLQHPDQRLLDIAAALRPSGLLWTLLGHNAKGSTHPLGTDLALHNAIKNGRTITVNSLLNADRSDVNGTPGCAWKPLIQATFWNRPDIVRLLLDKGARVNDTTPPLNGQTSPVAANKSALQMALDRRADNYLNQPIKERCEKIIKMLLDASADIHVSPAADQFVPGGDMVGLSPFETFLRPLQGNPLWFQKLSELETECLAIFLRKGADVEEHFNSYPCSSPTRTTFEHQILWHSTPAAARLLIDSADPTPNGNGANILHEIVGCCPDANRHPAETLRDVTVLLKNGADPNRINTKGTTVLRTCIRYCPAVDIVERTKALLEGGVNPNIDDGSDTPPIVEAARTLERPVLLPVIELLVAKYAVRYLCFPKIHPSIDSYFPIPERPNFEQVLWYTSRNGEFQLILQDLLPEDVTPIIQKAAFSVASKKYLDTIVRQPRPSKDQRLTDGEKEEMWHIVTLRKVTGFPPHPFNLDLMMGLVLPESTEPPRPVDQAPVSNPPQQYFAMFCQQAAKPAGISEPVDLTIPGPSIMDGVQAPDTLRRASTSSIASNESGSSFFVPSTTQIRCPRIGQPARPGDAQKAWASVLKLRCEHCRDDRMLTEAEYEKHEEEHYHTLSCDDVGCKRRFCIAERG
ncbi:ankyrin [Lophiostoma macrostomum CBS 122681]|uniref:Ankyrin n=1 Tax=Lophiostoma macrostomum CBS 122681 TaxID=1314788 RepID=A0A6A6SZJ4_9PLEO|nr:ankyrin [Lophiostoma macrostomum CBS 122681]